MAVPDGTLRFSILATIQGGERLVHTLHATPQGADFDLQRVSNGVRDAWTTMLATGYQAQGPLGVLLAGTTVYSEVKAYRLGADGRAIQQAASVFGATAKGTATTVLPNEVAMAVSLTSSTAGRRGRGRIFLGGLMQGTIDAAGLFSTNARTQVAGNIAGLLDALNNNPEITRVCILSKTYTVNSAVTGVNVGSVPDVQRRRRNGLIEQRTAVALAVPTS